MNCLFGRLLHYVSTHFRKKPRFVQHIVKTTGKSHHILIIKIVYVVFNGVSAKLRTEFEDQNVHVLNTIRVHGL